MTYPNDPNFRPPHRGDIEDDVPATAAFTKTTWAGIGFMLLLFGGIALWAYSSGDMQTSALKEQKAGIEQTLPPVTTGQGGASSRMPQAKDTKSKDAR